MTFNMMPRLVSPLALIKTACSALYRHRGKFFHIAAPPLLVSLAVATPYHLIMLDNLPNLATGEFPSPNKAGDLDHKDKIALIQRGLMTMLPLQILFVALASPFMSAWSRFLFYEGKNPKTAQDDPSQLLSLNFVGIREWKYFLRILVLVILSLGLGLIAGTVVGAVIARFSGDFGKSLVFLIVALTAGIIFSRFSLILPDAALGSPGDPGGWLGWWKDSWRRTGGQTASLLAAYAIIGLIMFSLTILLLTLSAILPKMPHDIVQTMFYTSLSLTFDYIIFGLIAGVSSLSSLSLGRSSELSS